MLLWHGGWKSCSLSQQLTESRALVHHLGQHRLPVGSDPDVLLASAAAGIPPRRPRHDDHLLVAVVTFVALRPASSVAALLEAVEGQGGAGAAGDLRRAVVLRVRLAGLAAVGVEATIAVAGGARDIATGLAVSQ